MVDRQRIIGYIDRTTYRFEIEGYYVMFVIIVGQNRGKNLILSQNPNRPLNSITTIKQHQIVYQSNIINYNIYHRYIQCHSGQCVHVFTISGNT